MKKKIKVILYTMPSCAYCDFVKGRLERMGVEFETIDASVLSIATELFNAAGVRTVPVLMVGDEYFTGSQIEQWLNVF